MAGGKGPIAKFQNRPRFLGDTKRLDAIKASKSLPDPHVLARMDDIRVAIMESPFGHSFTAKGARSLVAIDGSQIHLGHEPSMTDAKFRKLALERKKFAPPNPFASLASKAMAEFLGPRSPGVFVQRGSNEVINLDGVTVSFVEPVKRKVPFAPPKAADLRGLQISNRPAEPKWMHEDSPTPVSDIGGPKYATRNWSDRSFPDIRDGSFRQPVKAPKGTKKRNA